MDIRKILMKSHGKAHGAEDIGRAQEIANEALAQIKAHYNGIFKTLLDKLPKDDYLNHYVPEHKKAIEQIEQLIWKEMR